MGVLAACRTAKLSRCWIRLCCQKETGRDLLPRAQPLPVQNKAAGTVSPLLWQSVSFPDLTGPQTRVYWFCRVFATNM